MNSLLDIKSGVYYYLTLLFVFFINISIAVSYLFATLLFAGFILWLIVNARNISSKFSFKKHLPPFAKYFLLYIFFTLISILFSIDPYESFVDSKELLIFILFPLFFLILNSEKKIRTSLTVILVSTVIHSFYGIYQALKWGVTTKHRIIGFTSHWMTFAGLLMFVFIFFFIDSFYESKKKRFLYTGLLIPILIAIAFSLTRSVWVGLILAIGTFIIYFNPKILYIAVPLLLIVFFILPQSVKNRFSSITDINNATNKDRIYMLEIGFGIFEDYPLFGVGANNIKKVYNKYKPQGALNNEHLHNNFVQTLAERGIFTLLSLFTAFISIIYNLIKIIKNTENSFRKKLSIAILFTFFGFLTAGMFEYNFGHSQIKFILFFFLSLPFIDISTQKEVGGK